MESSAINQPPYPFEGGPNEPTPEQADEAAAFFDDPEEIDPDPVEIDTDPDDEPLPEQPLDLSGGHRTLTAEQAAAEAAAYRESRGETSQPLSAPQDASQRGPISREYIVFERVALTAQTLRALLKEVETGTPQVRVAHIELYRAVARNDRQAVAEAYNANEDMLGVKCDLAAVSTRSFKIRHIAPERVPAVRRITIT